MAHFGSDHEQTLSGQRNPAQKLNLSEVTAVLTRLEQSCPKGAIHTWTNLSLAFHFQAENVVPKPECHVKLIQEEKHLI